MSTINVNIEKIKESGKDIKELSFEFINLIDDFYNRINLISTKTNEWIGSSSVEFIRWCMLEKSSYIKYGNSLKELGESLVKYSEELVDRKKDSEEKYNDQNKL